MKRFLALAIAALMIFSCAACSSDGNGDTTAAEGTTAADTVSDVIAAPANDDTTAPSETAAPAENGGNTASPAPADRNNNINIIMHGKALSRRQFDRYAPENGQYTRRGRNRPQEDYRLGRKRVDIHRENYGFLPRLHRSAS